MPLPRFLMLIAFVIVLAGATIALAYGAGLPLGALAVLGLAAAAALRLWTHER